LHKTIDEKHKKSQVTKSKKKLSLPIIKTSLLKSKLNEIDYFMINNKDTEKIE
jgi:hypothetical protein